MKKIQTVYHHKQCRQYYEAKERGDLVAMHIWFQPPTYKPWHQIKAEMDWQYLVDSHEAEMKRIKETPNELLKIELELKYGKNKNKKKNRKINSNTGSLCSRIVQKWKNLFISL